MTWFSGSRVSGLGWRDLAQRAPFQGTIGFADVGIPVRVPLRATF